MHSMTPRYRKGQQSQHVEEMIGVFLKLTGYQADQESVRYEETNDGGVRTDYCLSKLFWKAFAYGSDKGSAP
jgi:hypothetical protein